ncbi:methionine adenosyltransferase [Schaalia sp. 19OD2882]|uniref:methionine adenosyltransferase n=1 Tax=Schaalia sp. 19OD2882 TaxID=2794089 RepID=UPI001C1ECFE6|nr:methionine adenosyltransferase [Schaalia sp. 19OD2882]QWW18696.1 methionine adenosyltransferase [Schaalia sp. 19OD2882]
MTTNRQLFTSESVTEGHPDKVCDRISDAILDAILEQDPHARVAVETMVTTGLVHVAGEVTTEGYVEIPHIVRSEICRIGYTSSRVGFDGASCGVSVSLGAQSPDIAGGVASSLEARGGTSVDPRDRQGAGDQGVIFGYASNDTPDLMPAPIWLAHRMAKRLAQVRRDGEFLGLRPDGKTQVTLGYEGDRPVGVETVVVSSQHDDELRQEDLRAAIGALVVDHVLDEAGLDLSRENMQVLVNPSGRFVLGGPGGDAGLTGRKVIVDTYGGMARHGGGAFSGKDPSKVDRSAAYAARWAAKNIVAAGLADRCELQVAYAIGRARPVSVLAQTFGTGRVDDALIARVVQEVFDLRPAGMIEDLDLLRPIYTQTSAYGHFGREGLPWERLDKVELLRAAVGA